MNKLIAILVCAMMLIAPAAAMLGSGAVVGIHDHDECCSGHVSSHEHDHCCSEHGHECSHDSHEHECCDHQHHDRHSAEHDIVYGHEGHDHALNQEGHHHALGHDSPLVSASVLDQEHLDENGEELLGDCTITCPTCSGSGLEMCGFCGGTGDCQTCFGIGTIDCSICMGSGICQTCGGVPPCGDCGDTGVCQPCMGSGQEDCMDCGATGDCPDCGGMGDVPCSTCGGSGFQGNDYYTAQTFIPGVDGYITGIRVKIANPNAFATNVYASVYSTAGGQPNNLLTSDEAVAGASVPAAAIFVYFNFTGTAVLNTGTQYAIVLHADEYDWAWRSHATGSYPNGQIWTSMDGGFIWAASPAADVVFSTYMSFNTACVAQDDNFTTTQNAILNGNVTEDNGNGPDTDADGDTLTVVEVNNNPANVSTQITLPSGALLNQSTNGTFEYDQNGTFDYLAVGEFFDDNYTYMISDSNGSWDNATVFVNVSGLNDVPTAVDDGGPGFVTNEAAAFDTANVLTNDTDPDTNDILSVSALDTTGTVGQMIDNADGTFNYDPNGQFEYLSVGQQALDFFNYTISDGNGGTDTAMVTITITGLNALPTAIDDTSTIDEDSGANAINVLANDNDPDAADVLLVQSVTQGGNGTVVITGGGTGLTYEPAANYFGLDTFTYTISDGHGGTDTATVEITVNNDNADSPVASDDTATINEDSGANIIDVLANDTDADLDTLTVINVTQAAHGTVTIINAGASVSYTPDADYYGTDTFTYNVTDGNGNNDTATVTVTVINVNDDPLAFPDSAVMAEDALPLYIDVLANDGHAPDPFETLTIATVTQGSHGTVTVTQGALGLTYEPDANFFGFDTFTYTIDDGNGGTATGTVDVTVNSVNDAPAISGTDQTTAESGDAYSVNYSASDVDGDTLTWTLTSTATWLAFNSTTGKLEGTAVAGTFTVTLKVDDGNGGSDTRTFTLTVTQLDTDDDGVPDEDDAFPNDANETLDTDDDGIGNNADDDDDGDGTPDADDAFPLDSAETLDTDGDGIGNNADLDDDGDGVPDSEDPEPTNPAITGNEPSTGWPYWWVLALMGIIGLIGLASVMVYGFVDKKLK